MSFKDVLSMLLAVTGFGFGLYQYVVGQRWRRAEFAAKQLEKLTTDPTLALCCVFLDWSIRRVEVPAAYRAFTSEVSFVHRWELLVEALAPESVKGEFPFPQVIYRDAFDRLFTYLESLEQFIEVRLVDQEHVASIEYWLRELASSRFAQAEHQRTFIQFAEAYGYSGVIRLMRRFGIT